MRANVGTRVAGWRLLELLGAGSMGEVWKAEGGGKIAAVKLLHADLSEPYALRRFERESRAILELSHPNVVRAIDFGQTGDGDLFLAMELLEGESLEQRLQRERTLPGTDVVSIGQQTAAGLTAAHAAGIIHRDVKPANLFLCTDGTVRLLDFGLALRTESWSLQSRLTRPGTVLGTPSYMAPEQASGARTEDERTDVWALGAVLHHTLAGKPPFWSAGHMFAELFRIATGEPDPLPPRVPDPLAAVVRRALSKEPSERFASMHALGEALAIDPEVLLPDTRAGSDMEPATRRSLETAATVWEAGASPRALHEEVRLVSAVVAEGISDDAALEAFFAEIRARGGMASAIRGRRAVGVFGGAEWNGDEAERAVQAALASREHAVRLGVGTGKATLGASGRGAVTGAALNAAADALERAAHESTTGGARAAATRAADDAAGEAVASSTGSVGACPETTRWIHGGFDLRGAQVLRQHPTSPPLGIRDVGGVAVPLAGRDRELAWLKESIERVRDESRSRAVLVVGPPGIGKSRLRHEVRRWLAASPGCFEYLEGRGDSTRAFASHAIIKDLLRRRADLPEGIAAEAAAERLQALVSEAGVTEPEQRGTIDFLGELLGIRLPENDHLITARADPRVMANRIRVALGNLFDAWSDRRPLVLALEDVQWADGASLALVDFLLVRLEEKPLAIIATARPEFRSERGDALPGAEVLELQELSRRAIAAIVECILQRPEPAAVERAAGNPYFAEELALAIREGADITALPVTVAGAVQSRLDKLPTQAKDLLKRAAVLGEVFWIEALTALGEPETPKLLTSLRRRGLVVPRSESRLADTREWSFRHAVVHEVCRAMLTGMQRRSLHGLAARWLEQRADAPDEVIASHYENAAEGARARWHWFQATRAAHRRGDSEQVVSFSERAVATVDASEVLEAGDMLYESARKSMAADALPLTPAERYELQMNRSEALFWLARPDDQEREISRLRKIEEEEVDEPIHLELRARARRVLAAFRRRSGRYLEAAETAREAISMSDAAGTPSLGARCRLMLSVSLAAAGLLDEASEAADEAVVFARSWANPEALSFATRAAAYVAGLRGNQSASVELWRLSKLAADEAGQIQGAAEAAMNVGAALQALGELEPAREMLLEALAAARRLGNRVTEAWASHNLGLVLARLGDTAAGLDAEDAAIRLARAARQPRLEAVSQVYRAAVSREAGDPEAALVAADAALAAIGATGGESIEPACFGIRAGALLDLGRTEEAEAECRRALASRDRVGGMEEFEVDLLVTHYQALASLGRDTEAEAALAAALACYRKKADRIEDTVVQEAFARNVPANARLLRLLAADVRGS